MTGTLFFGDNLHILREHIPAQSVDLIYLDPPFNSNRNYNVYLSTPKGQKSDAQITAFEDTWHWGEQAEAEYTELLRQPNTDVIGLITALRGFLHESDMMAYLVMMTTRLLEMYKVLKPTGSLYLHCDPTASHYLKIVLDNVFGPVNFRSEIIWKRSSAHGNAKRNYADLTDIILYYSKSDKFVFNQVFVDYSEKYLKDFYRYTDENGRKFRLDNLRNPGYRPNLKYDYKGYKPHPNGWAMSLEKMEKLDQENRLYFPKNPDGRIQLKRYLDEMPGNPISNIWDDLQPIGAQAAERLGYPTQKPLALLERIIQASSNPGDVVLDPFCGCGTAVHAAQKLGRSWLGIDITHLSIHLIERRMKAAFPNLAFTIHGEPEDLEAARDLAARDKYEFQFWACSMVGAQPYKGGKKGADTGIDGLIYFQDDKTGAKKIIVSVKGGEHVTRTMLADLKNTVDREGAQIGIFVTLAEPTDPMRKEAISAGYYQNNYDQVVPKIQIITIESLMKGAKPQYYDFSGGVASFKKAKTEDNAPPQPNLL